MSGFNPIPNKVRKIWEHWNIRAAILFSLLLQIILILFAPFRKRAAKKLIILSIWSGYLLADATASFTVGLISNSQINPQSKKQHTDNSDLLAFWAPFLLLHLGGPDTITAFSLEDNALWLRHLFAFAVQAVLTGYVFMQTLPNNKVMVPTILLFLAGMIKYLERTRSLYLASLDKFRDSMLKPPDPGPNYAKLMEEYASTKAANVPTEIIMIPEPEASTVTEKLGTELTHLEVVQHAYNCFNTFKGLIVDLIFSFKERNESREFFSSLSAGSALRVIETELNFVYEVLFTKAAIVHSKWGMRFRFISCSSVVAALAVFRFYVKKHGLFDPFDVGVTYTLLFGAIALEAIAFLMAISSDWTIAAPGSLMVVLFKWTEPLFKKWTESLFKKFPVLKRSTDCVRVAYIRQASGSDGKKLPVEHHSLAILFPFRRWSGSMSGHNLIRYCLKGSPGRIYISKPHSLMDKFLNCGCICVIMDSITKPIKAIYQSRHIDKAIEYLGYLCDKLTELVGIKNFIDEIREIWYMSEEPFTKELWAFIFDEIRKKSQLADDLETTKRIHSARGDWVLLNDDTDRKPSDNQAPQADDSDKDRANLMPYILDVSYDESLLLWHIATELLFNTDTDNRSDDIATESQFNTHTDTPPYKKSDYMLFSKILSDYMLYLLIMQPNLMAAVGGIGKIRFQDTKAEAQRFFTAKGLLSYEAEKVCTSILKVNTEVKPIAVKGDRSKSVLFDASRLAKELNKLKADKWKILSKVWVELLSFAASHCRATSHAQQVSKGGELITLVWLLMAHLGIGDQFQINEGHARAKLIVGK